ncbi:hypothetical protein MKX01_007607 [Papaver californicum]|nr:hypothetical protein MKX01_007607 [Papaver californicum]
MSRGLQHGRYLRCISSSLIDQTSFSSSSSPTHSYRFLNNQPSLCNKNFSSSPPSPPSTIEENNNQNETQKIALEISTELLKQDDDDSLFQHSLPLNKRLDLHFSNVIIETPNSEPEEKGDLGFNQWISSRPGFQHTDQKKDFKIIHDILIYGRGIIGLVEILKLSPFFDKMETDYSFILNRQSVKIVVSNLCENGYAEKMVKNLAHVLFPDECTCEMLIKGWCVDRKLDQAKRLAGEIHRGGIQFGTSAYNSILDCVCKLYRKKDNFRLQSEAEKILMDFAGVPRNVETFNILINNFCKIRRTKEFVKLFERMGEWGCSPNAETYLLLLKILYQEARIGEGDEMIDKMKSAGFLEIDHAMKVFAKMKADGSVPGIKSYELLIEKLCSHGQTQRANHLSIEAKLKGKHCLRKWPRKRKTLKKINLSFVKKPKKMMRRAY